MAFAKARTGVRLKEANVKGVSIFIIVLMLVGCAGFKVTRLERTNCLTDAIHAARTWSHRTGAPVGIAIGPTSKKGISHAQAFTIYEDKLQWLELGWKGIMNGRRHLFFPIRFLTVAEAEDKYMVLVDCTPERLETLIEVVYK